jgi:heat shock protein HslJ
MKKPIYLLVCIAIILFSACSSSKNSDTYELTGSSWELEYINGPRKILDSLFPVKKPQLTFKEENKTVTGNDGCNGYSAPFTLKGKNISFGEPGPGTLMYCGEGDAIFRETMKEIDGYKMEEKKLVLLTKDVPMMRFHKTNP